MKILKDIVLLFLGCIAFVVLSAIMVPLIMIQQTARVIFVLCELVMRGKFCAGLAWTLTKTSFR